MIVPTADNPFFAGLICEAQKILSVCGYSLLVCSSDNNAEQELGNFRSLIAAEVEGILCVSGLSILPEELLPAEYPLVWIDRHPASTRAIPLVSNDDAAAMELATGYLLDRGCRNILLMPGFLAQHQHSPRIAGYECALKERGIPVREEYILQRKGIRPTETETEEMVASILQKGYQVDGIIASSDRSAFGAITALRSVGLYVPEDVKLICFDNSPYSAMATPSLTALDRNVRDLAGSACQILLQQIRRENDILPAATVPVSLIERDSTR